MLALCALYNTTLVYTTLHSLHYSTPPCYACWGTASSPRRRPCRSGTRPPAPRGSPAGRGFPRHRVTHCSVTVDGNRVFEKKFLSKLETAQKHLAELHHLAVIGAGLSLLQETILSGFWTLLPQSSGGQGGDMWRGRRKEMWRGRRGRGSCLRDVGLRTAVAVTVPIPLPLAAMPPGQVAVAGRVWGKPHSDSRTI